MDEDKQTTRVQQTNARDGGTTIQEKTVARPTETTGLVIFQRVIWFLAGTIIVLLALRIILLLLAASQESGFVVFIYSISNLFAAPFYGIFNYTPSYGQFYFEVSSLVAMIVYALAAWGITKLVTLTRPNEEI